MSEPQAHLLVVDDDERIRGLLQKFLIRNGFLVTVARDAAQARRLLAGLDFDMIVLDVMMPGEDGISLTRDLRARLAAIDGGAAGAGACWGAAGRDRKSSTSPLAPHPKQL